MPTGGAVAQVTVCRLGPKAGSHQAQFCIHRVKRLNCRNDYESWWQHHKHCPGYYYYYYYLFYKWRVMFVISGLWWRVWVPAAGWFITRVWSSHSTFNQLFSAAQCHLWTGSFTDHWRRMYKHL